MKRLSIALLCGLFTAGTVACSSDSASSAGGSDAPEASSGSGEVPVDTLATPWLRCDDGVTDCETAATIVPESSAGPVSSSSSPYLWSDEFEGPLLDTAKWSFETGAGGWGNNEWQYYTSRNENAYIKEGILHIRANKESFEGSDYTSARLVTKGKFSFTYGTVEARIALPAGTGIWPAFWMLGENIDSVSWPACGEIDIIEAVNDENIVYGTNHWVHNGEHAEYGNNTGNFNGDSFPLDITQFHTYKLTWNSKSIAMFVDGFKYHEISIENNAGSTESFHKPFFFILNIAVAGNWPGFTVDNSQFPNEMLVDYIRVLP